MFWKQKKLAELHFEKKKHCINHVCILLRCIGALKQIVVYLICEYFNSKHFHYSYFTCKMFNLLKNTTYNILQTIFSPFYFDDS